MSKHILITGGTGYLGREIIRQSLRQNWRVSATCYSQQPPAGPGVDWQTLDVRSSAAVQQMCLDLRPDVIVHTAFRQTDPDMWAITASGAQHVATAARLVGARLIHLSSDVIFAGERVGAYTEDDPPSPIIPYGAAKADAERFVAAEAPAAVLVRTSLIYGFDPIDRHTQFILELADGIHSARLFHDEYRCPVFVGDLAAAILELTSIDYHGIINVAGSTCLSRYEFGVLLATFYGRDPAQLAGGQSSEFATPRPRNCTLDVSRARALLQTPLRGVPDVLAGRRGCS